MERDNLPRKTDQPIEDRKTFEEILFHAARTRLVVFVQIISHIRPNIAVISLERILFQQFFLVQLRPIEIEMVHVVVGSRASGFGQDGRIPLVLAMMVMTMMTMMTTSRLLVIYNQDGLSRRQTSRLLLMFVRVFLHFNKKRG